MREQSPVERPPAWFVVGLVGLCLAALIPQLWLRSHPWLGWGPMGSDAEFWLARASELASTPLTGTHPPVYPALVLVLSALWGTAAAGSVVAGLMGALLPVVGAVLGALAAGWRRGLAAGAATLCLPCLQFSALRAEATTTYGVGFGLVLLLALALERRRDAGAAVVLGLGLGLLTLTKEQGLVVLPGMALLPLLWRPRRPALVILVVAAWLVPVLPVVVSELLSARPGVLGKVALPVVDMAAWFTGHRIPGPLFQHRSWEPALDPGLADGGPLRIFWALARRDAQYAGVWVLLAPLSLGLLGSAAGRRRVTPEARRVLLLGSTGAVALLAVPVLARHVELALLPAAWALPLVLPVPAHRGARVGAVLVALAVVVASWVRVEPGEVAMLRSSVVDISSRQRKAEEVTVQIPADALFCTTQGWMAAFVERAVDCTGRLPAGGTGVVHVERVVVENCAPDLLGAARPVSESDVLFVVNDPAQWSRLVGLDCGAEQREHDRTRRLERENLR